MEIPDLGFQIAVKEQLNGDLIVNRERAELDAQVGLFAVVQNFWADFDLNRNGHCYGLVLIAIIPPRMHELDDQEIKAISFDRQIKDISLKKKHMHVT